MEDKINESVLEQTTEKEQIRPKENVLSSEEIREAEARNHNREENPDITAGTPEEAAEGDKGKQHEGMSSGAIGAVGAVAAVVVVITAIITNIVASFVSFKVFGTFFEYSIETVLEYQIDESNPVDLTNFDTGLRLVVFNKDTTQIVDLTTSNTQLTCTVEPVSSDKEKAKIKITFIGKVSGLSENTRYKAQIIGGDSDNVKTYDTKEFKTTGPKTEFFSVESECKCKVDGCFHFNLEYVDENNYYSNFSYEFVSADTSEVVASGSIEDPTKEQTINVDALTGTDYILIISFHSSAPGDVQDGKSVIKIEQHVKI